MLNYEPQGQQLKCQFNMSLSINHLKTFFVSQVYVYDTRVFGFVNAFINHA